jgi:hypothetical protein
MRTFERTRDVIDHVRHFHRALSEYFHRLSDQTAIERVKLLLDYLSRHEARLDEALSEYEDAASKRILENWFQYTTEKDLFESCRHLEVRPDMSIDDVSELALRWDSCLIEFYREMASCSDCEDVGDLFRELLKTAEQDRKRLSRDIDRFMDL